MRKLYLAIGCLLIINVFSIACKSKKTLKKEVNPTQIENPKPLTESQTDSLKNYLDAERAKRRRIN
jgi:hypothetical protein